MRSHLNKSGVHCRWRSVYPLVAMACMCSAAPAAADENPAFHVFSWGSVPESCDHITRVVSVSKADTIQGIYNKIVKIPKGLRCILGWDLHDELTIHPQDVCKTQGGTPTNQLGIWPDHGSEETIANYEKFFADFVYIGGTADVMLLDYEKNYHKISIQYNGGNPRWAAIEADPRFAAVATKLGFSDITPLPFNSPEYLKWNSVAGDIFDTAIDVSVYDVAKNFFPNIEFSNYGSYTVDQADPIYNYSGDIEFRETSGCGTHDARRFYGLMDEGLAKKKMDGKSAFGKSGWSAFLLETYDVKTIRRATSRPLHPWIPTYSYKSEIPGRDAMLSNSPYYDELVRQLAMHACNRVVYWNPAAWASGQNPADWNKPEDAVHLNDLADELNNKLAGAWIGPMTIAAFPWDTKMVAGGLKFSNKTVWRFSFAPDVQAVKVYIDGNPKVVAAPEGEAGAWLVLSPSESLDLDAKGLPKFEVSDPALADPVVEDIVGGEGFDPDYDSQIVTGDVGGGFEIVVVPSSGGSSGKSSSKSGSKSSSKTGSKSVAKAGKKGKGGGGGGSGGGGSSAGSSKSKGKLASSKKSGSSKSAKSGGKSSSSSGSSSVASSGKDGAAAKSPYSGPIKVVIVDVSALRDGTQNADGTMVVIEDAEDGVEAEGDPSSYASAESEDE